MRLSINLDDVNQLYVVYFCQLMKLICPIKI